MRWAALFGATALLLTAIRWTFLFRKKEEGMGDEDDDEEDEEKEEEEEEGGGVLHKSHMLCLEPRFCC